jgi:hypothetical protein
MIALARVKALQAEGLSSLRAIARQLTANQVLTVTGETHWDHRQVSRLLDADDAHG